MKYIFILLLFISSATETTAQDSTKVRNLQIMVRQLEYVTPQLINIDNDSLFQVFIDMRPKFAGKNPPKDSMLVTIDSIPTVELANLYNYCLSNSDGIGYAKQFKKTIAAARVSNKYLNRLCTENELFWDGRGREIRLNGRRLLRGKN
jgi:hypothetical protein